MAPTTFDPQGFLRLAGRLLRDLKRDDQAVLRTAVNRAYYAAFWAARAAVGERDAAKASHGHLITTFKRRARTLRLGMELEYLYGERRRADYDAATRFTRSSVRRYHRRATALIQALTTAR